MREREKEHGDFGKGKDILGIYSGENERRKNLR